jgi:hypothetical protein
MPAPVVARMAIAWKRHVVVEPSIAAEGLFGLTWPAWKALVCRVDAPASFRTPAFERVGTASHSCRHAAGAALPDVPGTAPMGRLR